MSVLQKLMDLGIEIPHVSGPFGAYVPAKRAGNLVFVAGQLPVREGQMVAMGPVPSRCSIEVAREAAGVCVLNALAAVRAGGMDLDMLKGVVRVGVFVSSDPNFVEQPKVADGASEFLIQLFGDAGRHVRAAVGVNSLPRNASVEVEFVFELVPH